MTTPCRHKGPKVVDGKVIRCMRCGKSAGIVSVRNDIRAEAQMTKDITAELRDAWDDADHGECAGFVRCEAAVTAAIVEIELLRDQRDSNLAKEVEQTQRLNAEIERLRSTLEQIAHYDGSGDRMMIIAQNALDGSTVEPTVPQRHDGSVTIWVCGPCRTEHALKVTRCSKCGSANLRPVATVGEEWEKAKAAMSGECEHLRSELLAVSMPHQEPFEMRKCLDCTKIFRVRKTVGVFQEILSHHPECGFHSNEPCDCGQRTTVKAP